MTLEQELLAQGFEAKGPVEVSRIPEVISLIANSLDKGTPPPYLHLHIVQGKLARTDMNDYPGLYMIYFSTTKKT